MNRFKNQIAVPQIAHSASSAVVVLLMPAKTIMVRKFNDEFMNYDLDVFLPSKGKNLQRDYCWILYQQQNFILSVMRGVNIPQLTILGVQQDGVSYKVIDGKQRLTTISRFFNDAFAIVDDNGNELLYSQMSRQEQDIFRSGCSSIKCNIAWVSEYDYPTDDQLIDWFLSLYAGTPQDVNHIESLKQLKLQ